jgi:hypothetical protein
MPGRPQRDLLWPDPLFIFISLICRRYPGWLSLSSHQSQQWPIGSSLTEDIINPFYPSCQKNDFSGRLLEAPLLPGHRWVFDDPFL